MFLPYSSDKTEEVKPIPAEPVHLAQAIQAPVEPPRKSHILMLVGGTLGILALGAAGFFYYYFFLQKPLPNVSLEVSMPDKVALGQEFSAAISYSNNSAEALRNATVSVSLPQGATLLSAPDQRFWEENVGEISPGAYGKREIKLVIVSDPQSVKNFVSTLRYSVTNDSGSQFRSEQSSDVAVSGPAVDASINFPQGVMSGQDFLVVVNYANNLATSTGPAELSLVIPQGVEIKESTSTSGAVMTGNGVWDLGTLNPNATGSITMSAGFTGTAGQFNLPFKINTVVETQKVETWTQSPVINVTQAPLAVIISVNGVRSYPAHTAQNLSYQLAYKNNSQVPLQDIKIVATLSGSMFDLAGLQTKGVFNSINNTITWSSANTPALSSLGAGASGIVDFSVPLKAAFPIRRISDKNYSVSVGSVINSPTVPPGIEATQTISQDLLETKLSGDIALAAPAYYYEPSAGVKNTGPYPPKVNKTTQFTVHWQLRNSATDMKQIHVVAKLGTGVNFVKAVKSTTLTQPIFDASSGTVSWDVPVVQATQGMPGVSAPAEAVFQVSVVPAVNQVGQVLQLISDSSLSATDGWTGESINRSAPSQDTSLQNDPRVVQGNTAVQP